MQTQKISISLPKSLYDFVEGYQEEHHYKSRSEVITRALRVLQKLQLESCYREANQEVDESFDITVSDGIDNDETW